MEDAPPLFLLDFIVSSTADGAALTRETLATALKGKDVNFIYAQQVFGLDPRIGYPPTIAFDDLKSLFLECAEDLFADERFFVLSYGDAMHLAPHLAKHLRRPPALILIQPQWGCSPKAIFDKPWFSEFPEEPLEIILENYHGPCLLVTHEAPPLRAKSIETLKIPKLSRFLNPSVLTFPHTDVECIPQAWDEKILGEILSWVAAKDADFRGLQT